MRYDQNDGQDAEGKKVADDSEFSPRLGATWSPNDDWTINASYGRYIAAIANTIADASSSAGSAATYWWLYDGPSINVGGPLDSSEDALATVFDWLNPVGGTNNTDYLVLANIPGGSLIIATISSRPRPTNTSSDSCATSAAVVRCASIWCIASSATSTPREWMEEQRRDWEDSLEKFLAKMEFEEELRMDIDSDQDFLNEESYPTTDIEHKQEKRYWAERDECWRYADDEE